MDSEMKIDTFAGVASIRVPKEIAKITICGALTLIVTDVMKFTHPTKNRGKI